MPLKTPAFWYKDKPTWQAYALMPAMFAYKLGEFLNRRFSTPKPIDIPVIAIGNAVAGGGGKTPTTIAVIQMLKRMGHTPHIITRGYGREAEELMRVDHNSDASEVGDEPLLLARHAPCWVFNNRREAAVMAMHAGASVVVMDDGLQHYSLQQDFRICCISGRDGFGNGLLLPAGPLRQSTDVLFPTLHANMIIGKSSERTRKHIYDAIPRYNAKVVADRWEVKGKRVFAFAGIARPERFFDMLAQEGATVVAKESYADHHRFSAKEYTHLLESAAKADAQLVCTAKDFVRLSPEFKEHVTGLDITLSIPEEAALQEQLQHYLSHVYNAA